ncbi:MAG: hypothetical protein LAO79_01520 [Acidobacteriia bacterium]|nr:hypothetical protein [Terriglobia bacterium]
MRILLDECIDQRLRHCFGGHDCQTAAYANFAGLKNGRLLEAAEQAGFEVLITVDQEIPSQQNLSRRGISIVILCAPSNRLHDLEMLLPAALSALDALAPGDVVRIEHPAI